MFHIGVLAPSLTSAAVLLRHLGPGDGDAREPEVTLSCAPLGSVAVPWQRGDVETVRSQLVLSSARLRRAGAHFVVCTEDSVYAPLDVPGPDLALPGLHAASVVAQHAQRLGFATLGVLGTRWTLSGHRYDTDLVPMGIRTIELPLRDQTTLHSIIFDELVHDRHRLRSRDLVLEMLHGLHSRGCEAVILGCPELVELVGPAISPVPLLDPTALLAGTARAVAAGEVPLPDWYGGPCGDPQQRRTSSAGVRSTDGGALPRREPPTVDDRGQGRITA